MNGRRLRLGRSRGSWLVWASHNVHVFVWTPRTVLPGSAPSYGCTVRRRAGEGWRHVRLILWQHNTPARHGNGLARSRAATITARPTLTLFELSSWRTTGGTRERGDVKAYARFKVGPGGTVRHAAI